MGAAFGGADIGTDTLISIEDLSRRDVDLLLDTAESFLPILERDIKKTRTRVERAHDAVLVGRRVQLDLRHAAQEGLDTRRALGMQDDVDR